MNMDALINYSVCQVKETEKFAAIDEVIDNCSVFDGLSNSKERFRRAVHRREIIETTGIGHGIAVAHGKLPCVDHLRIGLGISKEGINFKSKDGKPVHLLFVIASTPFHQINYLKALAVILRSARNSDIKNEVLGMFEPGFDPKFCNDFLDGLTRQDFNYSSN